jgi:uncharacterized protein (TIGR00255 family)
MTGFGVKEIKSNSLGKISVELRSTNHKFLEIVLHLPEGFLFLEDRIKKEIDAKLNRGRVTCVVNIAARQANNVFINRALLKKYAVALKSFQQEFRLRDALSLDALIRLPGVFSLEEAEINKTIIWPKVKMLLGAALGDLLKMRRKEGLALQGFLKNRALMLKKDLDYVKTRFKKAVKVKTGKMKSDEERIFFLKDSDITEEIERLAFHIRNFTQKLLNKGPIGKELDFIAQEMQREANTMVAKSFDAYISARIVQLKSQIEKIREQVQNIE